MWGFKIHKSWKENVGNAGNLWWINNLRRLWSCFWGRHFLRGLHLKLYTFFPVQWCWRKCSYSGVWFYLNNLSSPRIPTNGLRLYTHVNGSEDQLPTLMFAFWNSSKILTGQHTFLKKICFFSWYPFTGWEEQQILIFKKWPQATLQPMFVHP